jgi:phosphoglycerate dehydrogenase-like enzyme
MSDLKIVFNQKRKFEEQTYIRSKLGKGYNIYFPKSNSEDEIVEELSDADVLVGVNITRRMLEEGKDLKIIQIPHAGVEGLDFELIKQYNIPVYNTHSNALSVAELAVGLILGIAKKIPYHDKLFRTGNWNSSASNDSWEEQSISSSYVSNKTISFIGYGNIGKKIAELLSGFNCKYMAIVNNKKREYKELDFVGDINDLEYVLKSVDYLVVAAPLTKKTRGMLNKSNLVFMKNSAYIINISRGKVIDEESLYYMLSNNLIRGAALDAWYNYPKDKEDIYPSKRYEFHKLNNLIMSPHRADAIYGEEPHIDDAIRNIIALKEGLDLINKVDLEEGY